MGIKEEREIEYFRHTQSYLEYVKIGENIMKEDEINPEDKLYRLRAQKAILLNKLIPMEKEVKRLQKNTRNIDYQIKEIQKVIGK